MIDLIEQHRTEIQALCVKHSVKKLELFGSAARGEFVVGQSDLDFFVEFVDYTSPAIADQWFGLQEDLQELLQAPVELVSTRTATNPYFIEVANRSRVTLYAA